MAQLFDLLVLTLPQAAAEGNESFKDTIDALLSKNKIKPLSCEEWGEKQLAYPVLKHERGNYYLYVLEADAKQATAINMKLKHEKGILRYLLTKKVVQPTVEEKAE